MSRRAAWVGYYASATRLRALSEAAVCLSVRLSVCLMLRVVHFRAAVRTEH